MTEFNEVTAQNLKLVRGSRGMNQDQVAEILGLSGYHISNVEKGKRALSTAEKSLLDLYFFGTVPFEIVNEKLLHGVLDFTEDQWRVVSILASRQGQTPGTWIANQIRSYLAFNEEAKSAQADITRGRLQSLPHPEQQQSSKVADEPN